MNPGDTVRWWTKDGGWRFGHLASVGRIHARVSMGQSTKRVPLEDLRPWPPAPAASSSDDQDTTPPARRAKRKGKG